MFLFQKRASYLVVLSGETKSSKLVWCSLSCLGIYSMVFCRSLKWRARIKRPLRLRHDYSLPDIILVWMP